MGKFLNGPGAWAHSRTSPFIFANMKCEEELHSRERHKDWTRATSSPFKCKTNSMACGLNAASGLTKAGQRPQQAVDLTKGVALNK